MANWSNPTLTSTYTDFLGELKNRDDDLAKQFDGTTSSNLATGTIRWNSTANRWQKWNGSAWAELTGTYALTALTTTGNASIGGTLAVTGAATLAAATATTPATGNNSTAVATTAYVRAQAYAPLASPALTGTPTVPTAAVDTNSTQAASTAFVQAEIANDAPSKTGTGASGTWGISVTGSAATVTTNANLTGDVTSVGNATSIAAGVIVNADISGSAGIADTKLATISTAGKVSGTAITSGNIATSGELQITNSAPAIRLTESDGTATNSQTILLKSEDQFSIQTRNSTGVTLSNDYIIPSNASGATDHIWRIANTEKARLNSSGLTVVDNLTISDKIIHASDPNTAIRFPAADTVTVETGGVERTRVDSSGNLLVGTTVGLSPTTTTSVGIRLGAGGILVSSREDATTGLFQRTGTDGAVLQFHKETTNVGSISVTASATAYNTSSDYRLKENVVPLDGAIARLNQLPVHRFNFIADPDTVVDGFIAHEAAVVVPECVTGEKDEEDDDGNPIYQGIDQSKVVPLLTAALQEAIAMIGALETRIAALEA